MQIAFLVLLGALVAAQETQENPLSGGASPGGSAVEGFVVEEAEVLGENAGESTIGDIEGTAAAVALTQHGDGEEPFDEHIGVEASADAEHGSEPRVAGAANIVRHVWERKIAGDAQDTWLPYFSSECVFSWVLPSSHPVAATAHGLDEYLAALMRLYEIGEVQSQKLGSVDEFEKNGALHVLSVVNVNYLLAETGRAGTLECLVEHSFTSDGGQIASQTVRLGSDHDFSYLPKDSAMEVLRKYISSGGSTKYLAEDVVVRRGFSIVADLEPELSSSKAEHIAFNERNKDNLSTSDVRIVSLSGGDAVAIADITFKSYVGGKSHRTAGTLYAWMNEEGRIRSLRFSPADWDEFLLGKPIKEDKKVEKDKKKKK